jgi:D-alanine--poly(phosphoribitol) ligase subunit 2
MTSENLVASVLNEILRAKGQSISGYDERIFESGLIDSFGIVELVLALEDHFQIKISYEDMTIQNFESINEISKLIDRLKCKGSVDND